MPQRPRTEGPTLILVPGLDGTALLFYRQIPLLARRFHVVAFPLPDESTSTMETLIEQLRQLMEQLAPGERVFLCGESFGGALSLSFALAHPELVAGLIVLNSFPVLRQRLRLRVAPSLLRLMPWGAMGLVRRFTESRLHTSHTLSEDLREFHERMKEVGRMGYIRRLEILARYDIRERLPEIQAPSLFLAGDEDHLIPSVQEARYMASRVPNSSLRILKGYGHICLITHDFNLLDYIAPWMDRINADNPGMPSHEAEKN